MLRFKFDFPQEFLFFLIGISTSRWKLLFASYCSLEYELSGILQAPFTYAIHLYCKGNIGLSCFCFSCEPCGIKCIGGVKIEDQTSCWFKNSSLLQCQSMNSDAFGFKKSVSISRFEVKFVVYSVLSILQDRQRLTDCIHLLTSILFIQRTFY